MKPINPAYVAALKAQFASAPYPSLLSMRMEELTREGCLITLDVAEKHLQPFGIVHGGVIATLVDTATFWAVFLSLADPGDGLVNVDLKLNYLTAVSAGGVLRARGTRIRMGRTIGYAQAEIHDHRERLVAHGTSTLMALPGKGLQLDLPREL